MIVYLSAPMALVILIKALTSNAHSLAGETLGESLRYGGIENKSLPLFVVRDARIRLGGYTKIMATG